MCSCVPVFLTCFLVKQVLDSLTHFRVEHVLVVLTCALKERVLGSLTCFLVEHDLLLELAAPLQGGVDVLDDGVVGLGAVEELAGAALLHHLGAHKARQLAEAIRAVHDRVALRHLRIGQDEVAVCDKTHTHTHINTHMHTDTCIHTHAHTHITNTR